MNTEDEFALDDLKTAIDMCDDPDELTEIGFALIDLAEQCNIKCKQLRYREGM